MTTYYVNGSTGSNNGAGSSSSPWKTIQYGIDQLTAGDTLIVKAGTYQEVILITTSGTAAQRITIKAADGESVTVDGNYTLPTGGVSGGTLDGNTYYAYNDNPLVRFKNCQYITWDGIDIKRSKGRGLQVWGGGYHIIQNCSIYTCRRSLVHSYPYDNVPATDNTFRNLDCYTGGDFAPFSRSASQLDWPVGFNESKGENSLVENVSVHEHWGEGMNIGTGGTIRDCILYDNYAITGIYLGHESNLTVERNLIYHTEDTYLRNGSVRAGIVLNNETGSTTPNENFHIRNNILINCGIAIWGSQGTGLGHENIYFYNNTIVLPQSVYYTSPAVDINTKPTFSNVKFFNNIFLTETTPVAPSSAESGITFSHNCWTVAPPAWADDANDYDGDPALVDDAAVVARGLVDPTDYQLTVSSNCIDAGTSTGAPSDDYFGNVREGSIDIGAHEYGAGTAPTPEFTEALFDCYPKSGCAPLDVEFEDLSEAATEWSWEISTDGFSTSTEISTAQTFVYTFDEPGVYDVRLTAGDGVTSDTETKLDHITVEDCCLGESGTVSVAISAGADDGRWNFFNFATDTAEIRVGDDYASRYDEWIFMTFRGIDIPQGATIINATVTVTVTDTDGANGSIAIQGEDEDTGTAITSVADYESRNKTTAITNWNWAGLSSFPAEMTSDDFSDVVQEIIDRPGWVSGNDITLFFTDAFGAGFQQQSLLQIYAYDQSSGAYAPTLNIEYGLPAPEPAFSGSPTSGDQPLSVDFTNSTVDNDVTITGWLWERSDDSGTTWETFSTAENPSGIIFGQGSWDIKLTAQYGACDTSAIEEDYIVADYPDVRDWFETGIARGIGAGLP